MRSFAACALAFVLVSAAHAGEGLGPWGPKFTRAGAEAGGNATGEIPPFEGAGGLECPEGYQKGDFLPNPYKDEKILFRIDHTNVERYKDRLSPGQIARLKRNKHFYMNVYPTHRNMEFPEIFYRATEKNRKTCRLDEKNILHGFNGGIPFPFPTNGVEAMWNVKKPWAGNDLITNDCRRLVSPSGRIRKTKWTTKIMAFDETRLTAPIPNPGRVTGKGLTFCTYPADKEGEAVLTVTYIDDDRKPDTWVYAPVLNRVRRVPILTGGTQTDGEATVDELGFDYRYGINEWEWRLLGKRELYIPMNTYDLWQVGARDEEECLPGDMNPARLRYELHRVWVVEGTHPKEKTHPYSRRVTYYDEDTWAPAVADRYDRRGGLWRMAEYFQVYDYCGKHRVVLGYIYLNLLSGRYELYGGCRDEKTRTNATDVGLKPEEFTIQALRRLGR